MPVVATIRTDLDPCPLVIAFLFFEVVGYVILWPIIRHDGGTLAIPRQFSVADFVALIVYLQVALGFCAQFRDVINATLVIVLCAAVVVLWGAGVSILNRRGIMRFHRRMLFLLIFLPLTLFAMLFVPIVLPLGAEFARLNNLALNILVIGGSCLFGVIILPLTLRRFAAWFVEPRATSPSGPESDATRGS